MERIEILTAVVVGIAFLLTLLVSRASTPASGAQGESLRKAAQDVDEKRIINYEDDGGVMDPECIPICEALNKLPFIETISSCCGHSYAPLRIYFTARNVDALKPILAEIDEWDVWRVRASMATGNMEVYFILEGVMGNEAYAGANYLAARLALSAQGGTG